MLNKKHFNMKNLALLTIAIFYCLILNSQQIQKYDLYTTSPLISNEIHCIKQLEDGIYVGQGFGLTRFTGNTYNHLLANSDYRYMAIHDFLIIDSTELWIVGPYCIVHKKESEWTRIERINNIEIEVFYRIAKDDFGRIWLTTYNGLFMFYNNTWTHFTQEDGLLDGQATALTIDGTNVYVAFGTHMVNHGVSKFDGESWTNFTPDDGIPGNYINKIFVEENSTVWFCTNQGVAKFDGTNWVHYTTQNGLASNHVNCMEVDNYGNYWFGTFSDNNAGGGVSKFDGISWESYSLQDGLPSNKIMQMEYTCDNKLWLGGFYSGVFILNLSPEEFGIERTIQVAGIGGFNIFSPYVDKNNTLWTLAGGLTHFADNEWTSYIEGFYGTTTSIFFEDKFENLIYGGYGSFSIFNGTSWSPYDLDQPNDYVKNVALDTASNIWFSSYYGVLYHNGHHWTTYTTADGLIQDDISFIDCDKDNNIWCSAGNLGICKYDQIDWHSYMYPEDFVISDVSGFEVDKNNHVWISAWDAVYSFDGEIWTQYDSEISQDEVYFTSIAVDTNNTVWAGSRNLHKYDGISWTEVQIEDSISDGQIDEIIVDKTNNLWLKFNAAIYYVIMSNSYNVEEYSNSDFTPIIYPNPAIDDVTIDFPGEKAIISIYDLSGREIKTFVALDSLTKISTSDFINGTYIIKINNGAESKSLKLIISH